MILVWILWFWRNRTREKEVLDPVLCRVIQIFVTGSLGGSAVGLNSGVRVSVIAQSQK